MAIHVVEACAEKNALFPRLARDTKAASLNSMNKSRLIALLDQMRQADPPEVSPIIEAAATELQHRPVNAILQAIRDETPDQGQREAIGWHDRFIRACEDGRTAGSRR